jgi:sulfonate dioxygenase
MKSVPFNQILDCTHTATLDFQPQTRHALRASPRGEKPKFIEEERQTDKVVEDGRNEILKEQGIEIPQSRKGLSRARGYNN